MAGLASGLESHAGTRLTAEQFRAIAWLRWRILANGFRRKGGAGELIGRILLLPFVTALVLLPAAMAGFFAFLVTMENRLDYLSLVFWGAFGLTQLLNINLGQPGTTFDPTELIRFPMALRSYILVRLCFGLLSPANVTVSLMSLAIFIGVTVVQPHLWPWTLLATATFGLANVLFSRMIFAWIDRWLSTRRAREIFTALIFVASLGFQYLNVTYNPGFAHGHKRAVTPQNFHRAQLLMGTVHPWLRWLPPELSSFTIIAGQRAQPSTALLNAAVVLAYAALFVLIYAYRMKTEYRGENLSDAANLVRSSPKPIVSLHTATVAPERSVLPAATAAQTRGLLPPSLAPLLGKEILVLRRNTGLLYGVVAPTVMVFLFAGRLSLHGNSQWLLLLAVGYALLGLAPISYNSFGLEGSGAQFYFMSPVPLREVFLAKNLMQFLLAMFEVCSITAIVTHVAGRPQPRNVLFVAMWAIPTLLLNTTIGNLRSISAPKKINPGKSLNRAQSQVSAWIAIGILLACAGIGAGLQLLAQLIHQPWLGIGLMALATVGAAIAYTQGLKAIEQYALDRRDTLFEELGKKT